MNSYFLIMLLSVLFSSISQILLKASAGKKHESFLREYLNPLVIFGYGLLLLSTLTTIVAYKGMDYKNGPIIEALGYILVMALSVAIFKEKVGKRKIGGYILIVVGIIVFYL